MKKTGFTLIEVMVALLILAGLSLLMMQSVRTGLQSKIKIQNQIDEESQIRDAMRLIAADIQAAFHHRDYLVQTYNRIIEKRKALSLRPQTQQQAGQQQPGGSSSAPPPAGSGVPTPAQQSTPSATQADPLAQMEPLPEPRAMTGFIGDGQALTFTVRNHVRRYRNAPESDQARISYFLQSCRKPGDTKGRQTQCLARTVVTEPVIEFPLTPNLPAQTTVIAENVTDFRLRYVAQGQPDYLETWNSTVNASSEVMRNRFPDAVEVSLGIHDTTNPQSRPQLMSWLVPIRNPNNPDETDREIEQARRQNLNPQALNPQTLQPAGAGQPSQTAPAPGGGG